jgi:hypothetical protein
VSYRIVWDDFRDGFATAGPARWSYAGAGPHVGDDGIVTTSEQGLRVFSSGTNPITGRPAFTHTVSHEDESDAGVPGLLDHVKWLVYANHLASSGHQGFDAVPGHELSAETWISGCTYGTSGQPFGSAVPDADDDLRLASAAMNAFDPESNIAVDFFLTNRRIYAFYERLPGARATLGNYAAFSSYIPVARRSPADLHHLKICYDRSNGVVRWIVDGTEAHRVDRLGYRPDRRYLALDHGGVETAVEPRQLSFGMGMFTLLDGALPGGGGPGLVRLSAAGPRYFGPALGEPHPQTFLDDPSVASHRLFGQGASLALSRYVISSVPTARRR